MVTVSVNFQYKISGHAGAVATHSPLTPEVGGSNPKPYVLNMVVSYRWLAVYSTELYGLVSSAVKLPAMI